MASPSENVGIPTVDAAAAAAASPSEEQPNPHLVRQSSVYSLTLDEFQHTVCEPGKSFGSMNMDEFIANIWTVEESQAVAAAMEAAQGNSNDGETTTANIVRQPSLHRQGSFTVPAPLSRKTVEEVWSEIHRDKGQQQQQQQVDSTQSNGNNNANNSHPNGASLGNTARQPTFGEMTLEDFLIKAGVVREACAAAASSSQQQQQQQQQYAYFRNNNGAEPDYAVSGNVIAGYGYSDHRNAANGGAAGGMQAYTQAFPQAQQQQQGAAMGDGMSNFGGGSSGRPAGCFAGRMGNGGSMAGGFGVGCGSPVSPVPSDGNGMGGGASQGVDNSVSQYGLEMAVGGSSGGVMRGSGSRKRVGLDGEPLEKGVERRQRRMIKNRESAARSRARKQAYTVELEAELEMLKEENARLRKEQEEEDARRKKKILEAMTAKAATTKGMKPKPLRRTFTGPW